MVKKVYVSVICELLYKVLFLQNIPLHLFRYKQLECRIRKAVYFCPKIVFSKLNYLNQLILVNSFKIGS